MSTYKGSGVVFLREQVRARGDALEPTLLEQLEPTERALYLDTMSISWVDAQVIARVFQAAAPLLFPDAADPLREFGRVQARAQLSGIYRVLLRVVSVPVVIQQSARLWSTYHSRGQARVQREGDAPHGQLIVEGYPELPLAVRRNTTGYIAGTLELTAVRDIRVREQFGDPQAWTWDVAWG